MLNRPGVLLAFALAVAPLGAQEPVVAVADPEALFVDDDPALHANKQLALHFMREQAASAGLLTTLDLIPSLPDPKDLFSLVAVDGREASSQAAAMSVRDGLEPLKVRDTERDTVALTAAG